jgi:hypothetical protein
MFLAYLKVLLRHSKRRHRHRANLPVDKDPAAEGDRDSGRDAALSSSGLTGSHSNRAALRQIEAAEMTVLRTTARALTILKST